MIGTLINSGAIVVGSAVGMALKRHLNTKYSDIITSTMGLVSLVLGFSMAMQSDKIMLIVISLVVGSLIGQFLDIDKRLNSLAVRLQSLRPSKADDSENRFVEGFVTTTMLFCVGSMAILGAIQDGMGGEPTILLTKAIMDGSVSIFFAATFGFSVMLSAIPVLIYQGAIALCATAIMTYLPEPTMNCMTATGGVIIIGLGITILGLRKINVANMLPALVVAVVLSYYI